MEGQAAARGQGLSSFGVVAEVGVGRHVLGEVGAEEHGHLLVGIAALYVAIVITVLLPGLVGSSQHHTVGPHRNGSPSAQAILFLAGGEAVAPRVAGSRRIG